MQESHRLDRTPGGPRLPTRSRRSRPRHAGRRARKLPVHATSPGPQRAQPVRQAAARGGATDRPPRRCCRRRLQRPLGPSAIGTLTPEEEERRRSRPTRSPEPRGARYRTRRPPRGEGLRRSCRRPSLRRSPTGVPRVNVPVLSKRTASIVRIRSSASRSLMRMPALAATDVEIAMTSGIASPRAWGTRSRGRSRFARPLGPCLPRQPRPRTSLRLKLRRHRTARPQLGRPAPGPST